MIDSRGVPKSMRQARIDPTPIHSYDPERARSLLKSVGLDTLTIDLSIADAAFAGAIGAAKLFKDSAAKAGIEINVIREADDGLWDNVWMKKPFVAMYWNGRATCDWMFMIDAINAALSGSVRAAAYGSELLATCARQPMAPDRDFARLSECPRGAQFGAPS